MLTYQLQFAAKQKRIGNPLLPALHKCLVMSYLLIFIFFSISKKD